jgi:hypothetical protein
MDKLELDARVARLERRFSLLLTVPFLVFGLLALAAILMTSVSRRSDSAVITTPPMPAPTVEVGTDDRNMHRLDGDLRKLHGLLDRNLIDRDEFQAKKRELFAPILHVTDFEGDIELAKALLDENIIDRDEYNQLKKKILEIRG